VCSSDLGVYKELPTKDSKYITDLKEIFKVLLDHEPTEQELKDFGSFIGTLKLIKKNLSSKEIDNVILGFSTLLWGEGAQGLVRGDPKEDFETKKAAYDLMLKELGKPNPPEIEKMIEKYYKSYKT
jgi:hypothetical protein